MESKKEGLTLMQNRAYSNKSTSQVLQKTWIGKSFDASGFSLHAFAVVINIKQTEFLQRQVQ